MPAELSGAYARGQIIPPGNTLAHPIVEERNMFGNTFQRKAACLMLAILAAPMCARCETLSLQDAIQAALRRNPSIAAGAASTLAAHQAARGASALANPELTVAPSVVGEAGSDSVVLLTQPLEINGTRTARARIAGHQASAATQDANAARRDVVLRVKLLYWETAQAQQLVRLNEENIAYLETLDSTVRKQIEVGKIPGAQAIKTEIELARARQELAQARLGLQTTKAELCSMLNRPPNDDVTIGDELVFADQTLDRDSLAATALRSRPEVLSSAAQVAGAQAEIGAARADRLPDLALQFRKESWDSAGGGIAVAITLPLLDWGLARAKVRHAELVSASRRMLLESARNEVTLEVDQSIAAARTSAAIVREYQGGILDRSDQLAALAQKGYEKGATSYIEVLEAQRTLRGVKVEYLSALADHTKAVARVGWAAGIDSLGKEASK